MSEPNDPKEHLLLYSSLFLTKGYTRSLIADPQRQDFYLVPNEVANLIEICRKKPFLEVLQEYEREGKSEDLTNYVKELEKNEMVFRTTTPERFPPIDLEYRSPDLLTNAILDRSFHSTYDLISAIDKLDQIGVKHLQVRFFDPISSKEIKELNHRIQGSDRIISYDLFLPYSLGYSFEELKNWILDHFKIHTITIHGSPKNRVALSHSYDERLEMGNIIYTRQQIQSEDHCGYISPEYFTFSSIKALSENNSRNSCLNQKVGVDKFGRIKNCPAMERTFGNIDQVDIKDVIGDEFKKPWFITKEQVSDCQVCEFRAICSDCRAFTENGLYSKPKGCHYDPYTGKNS